ncbi:FAD:protein FMN transferase [Flavobacterium panacagri]|uniref:FAD:protein FMN transferase n=1 Tax=Flavobacterium panacagri TaxID=3034146 RepID=UPI0025A5940A|nr:FAD:protein FMN transferase [Flavobacterium panacagri]
MLQKVPKQYLAQTRRIFHCNCKIKIPIAFGEQLLEKSFEILEEIDRKYNSYVSGSYFSIINEKRGSWVTVDQDCIEMIRTIHKVSVITKGHYDITCMPLLKLWGFYKENSHKLPKSNELKSALEKVNFRTILTDGLNVKINTNQEIITGSFIKAFAVDKTIEFLKKQGITDAIINAGGSTISALNDADHPSWKINVPDAFNKDEFKTGLEINSQTFSLSGNVDNHLIIGGKKYGHILNCITGYPAETAQTGVLTKNAFLGDILSTALFTVPAAMLDEVTAELKKHFDFDYFIIDNDNKKTLTECFQYLR